MTDQAPLQLMQRILGAARSRRFGDAAAVAAQGMADFPADHRLAALAGAIAFQDGQFESAVPLLEQALQHFPADVTIIGNLAESYYHIGQFERAAALCGDAATANDSSGRLLQLSAFLAQQAENYDRAALLYGRAVVEHDSDWSSWNNLGNAFSGLGQFDEAVAALRKAGALAPDSAPIQLNLANALVAAGTADEALELLTAVALTNPLDPAPMLLQFAILRDQGRADEAYLAIAEAAQRSPGDPAIRSDYAYEASQRHDYPLAESEFNAALSLDHQFGPAYVGLGSLYERVNREPELEPLLARAEAAGVERQSSAYIEALLHKRSGDLEASLVALEASADVILPGRKFHLRGVMLDRLGRHDEAFEAFLAMNAHWAEDPTQPKVRAALYRDQVACDTALLAPEWVSTWSVPPAADGRAAPIFLIGFPRSGTTLLDTMLMAEPRALVMEEESFLAELETRMGGIEAYPGLDQQALQDGRDFYFGQVATLGELGPDTIVIDKHPLHLNKVATIERFFPGARYITVLRHPCDVVLSCFLTNFNVNNAMANFLDLDDAADLYDLTFTHWDKAQQTFQLPAATVVYERLVEDTARELRPLFDWLGLDWPGGPLDHRDAARARGVVYTASYSQVTEPIYKRAAGRWHNYAKYLEPVFDRLGPWAERFGYSLTDGRIPAWPDRQI